ncbi:MAG: glycosyltransferase family 4 protein [Deltaproteobacteria bacterium]|jgi:glycosyltransferase involved in cell wall biosynthesis|nr:glycosyltransferase family 4 protein [Deltaproteobacteria bacterium]
MWRLLLVGAFPYPLAQGSQVYLQEQAQALRAAGDEITLLTYGQRGGPNASQTSATTATAQATTERALAGLENRTSPHWMAPRRTASGPGWGKPLADLGLAMTLRDALASKSPAARYNAILTHNAEACVIALGVRQILRQARSIPIVYCAHTLLGEELPTYLSSYFRKVNRNSSRVPGAFRGRLSARLGRQLDRWLARHADAWIALTQSAERVMRRHSLVPGERIPPPMLDPETESRGGAPFLPSAGGGLEPSPYFLYSGNLDGYQDLALLRATAERLAATGDSPRIVVATHDTRARRQAALGPGLEVRIVESAEEARTLLAGARASLLTRRAEGGFPIKLVNSLALGVPPIALRAREWGLEHGRNAWIGSLQDPVGSLCEGIRVLATDTALATRLGRGARALYLAEHTPAVAAARTHALLEQVIGLV